MYMNDGIKTKINLRRAMMRKSAHQETAQPVPCQMINCFCMYSDYTPLTLEEWVECDQRRRDKADR